MKTDNIIKDKINDSTHYHEELMETNNTIIQLFYNLLSDYEVLDIHVDDWNYTEPHIQILADKPELCKVNEYLTGLGFETSYKSIGGLYLLETWYDEMMG